MHVFTFITYVCSLSCAVSSLNVTRIVISAQLKCPKQLLSQKDDGRNADYVNLNRNFYEDVASVLFCVVIEQLNLNVVKAGQLESNIDEV